MATPEYLICLECETPCYTFEWNEGEVTEALCQSCGSDQVDQFISEDDYEAMSGPED